MTMGGFRLAELSDRSLLGDESRDEGLEDSERGEMGLGWRPMGESSKRDIKKQATPVYSILSLDPFHFHI